MIGCENRAASQLLTGACWGRASPHSPPPRHTSQWSVSGCAHRCVLGSRITTQSTTSPYFSVVRVRVCSPVRVGVAHHHTVHHLAIHLSGQGQGVLTGACRGRASPHSPPPRHTSQWSGSGCAHRCVVGSRITTQSTTSPYFSVVRVRVCSPVRVGVAHHHTVHHLAIHLSGQGQGVLTGACWGRASPHSPPPRHTSQWSGSGCAHRCVLGSRITTQSTTSPYFSVVRVRVCSPVRVGVAHHHTVHHLAILLKVVLQTLVRRVVAQPADEQLPEVLWFALQCGQPSRFRNSTLFKVLP